MPALYDLPEMKRRLAEIDAERDPLVRLIEAAEAHEKSTGGAAQASHNVTARQRAKPTAIGQGRPRTVLEITEDVAMEIIEANNRPVQTREVVGIMQSRGLPLPNKHVTNVVSARLSNSDNLEGRRGFGWWPKGRPWPNDAEIPFDEAAGSPDSDSPAASETPNSADEDGREVVHGNMSH